MAEGFMEHQNYFEALIADKPIRVQWIGGDKGKGVFAKKSIRVGDEVWTERPVVALQEIDNKQLIDGCAHCFKALGSIEEQLSKLLDGEPVEEFTSPPFPKKPDIASPVPCSCGEFYCSEQCREEAFDQYHCLLCSEGQSVSPVTEFVDHSLETNEIFLLAGRVVAQILCEWIKKTRESGAADLKACKMPFDIFHRTQWEDIIAVSYDPEDGEAPSLDIYLAIFKELLNDSVDLLKRAIIHRVEALNTIDPHEVERILDELVTEEFYSCVVGTFELNNISLEVPSPLVLYLEEVNSMTIEEGRGEAAKILGPYLRKVAESFADGDEEEDNDDSSTTRSDINQDKQPSDEEAGAKSQPQNTKNSVTITSELFPRVEGTALYSLVCSMNHSCVPNVFIQYNLDGSCSVRANRDIEEGEELCISYIEESEPHETRQEQLKEYLFTCSCAKCQESR